MTDLEARIQEIKDDRTSGSLELLSKIFDAFNDYFQESGKKGLDPETWEKIIRRYSKMFPAFPVIQHFFSHMASTGHPGLKTLGSRLHEYQAQWAEVDRQIAERALESIEPHWKTYLVHSQSQTLKTFFRRLAEQSEKAIVYQTESRPLFEGREQAKWLDRLGYQVHLITEAQCAHAVSESDAIVCGADRVYTDGFVNKVGTLNLAILAKYFRKPLLVLYDGRKWMDASAPRNKQEKNQDPEEIWERPEGHIEIRNYYFEWIPSHLVGTFISEAGIHMPNEPA